MIGEKALIQGDVTAEEVTVRGRVKGSIRALKVLLASTCHVEGDILHEAFAVETGAFFRRQLPSRRQPARQCAGQKQTGKRSRHAGGVFGRNPDHHLRARLDASRPAATATFAPLNTGA